MQSRVAGGVMFLSCLSLCASIICPCLHPETLLTHISDVMGRTKMSISYCKPRPSTAVSNIMMLFHCDLLTSKFNKLISAPQCMFDVSLQKSVRYFKGILLTSHESAFYSNLLQGCHSSHDQIPCLFPDF